MPRLLPIFLFFSLVSTTCSDFAHQSQQTSESCQFESNDNGGDREQKIMNSQQSRKREGMRYQIIAVEACEPLAQKIEEVSLLYDAYLRKFYTSENT